MPRCRLPANGHEGAEPLLEEGGEGKGEGASSSLTAALPDAAR